MLIVYTAIYTAIGGGLNGGINDGINMSRNNAARNEAVLEAIAITRYSHLDLVFGSTIAPPTPNYSVSGSLAFRA